MCGSLLYPLHPPTFHPDLREAVFYDKGRRVSRENRSARTIPDNKQHVAAKCVV